VVIEEAAVEIAHAIAESRREWEAALTSDTTPSLDPQANLEAALIAPLSQISPIAVQALFTALRPPPSSQTQLPLDPKNER